MNAVSKMSKGTETPVWESYRHNFSRHLIGVARHMQTAMMDTLQQDCGHDNLRLGFAPYITLVAEKPHRPSELAGTLGITRQACNQVIRQVEAAGYMQQTADPDDRRARLLTLTDEGHRLHADGARIVVGLDQHFARIVGSDAVADSSASLRKIYRSHALGGQTRVDLVGGYRGMGGLLPRLSDYIMQRLMELSIDAGHPGLKLSFGSVLTLIGPSGGKIQQIAAINDVSKQAISAIASELEQLGYLEREADSRDGRQIMLRFTEQGEQLIADSVNSVQSLELEFSEIIGKAAMERLKKVLAKLYRGLGLEQEVFELDNPSDLTELAKKLRLQLGEKGSRNLARLLTQAPTI